MGTDRGLPISCFGIDTPDSIRGISLTNAELMKLTSQGGGVGISVSRIRPRGAQISGNGKSEGVVPWCKIYDSAIIATNQGSVRRGAASVNKVISVQILVIVTSRLFIIYATGLLLLTLSLNIT